MQQIASSRKKLFILSRSQTITRIAIETRESNEKFSHRDNESHDSELINKPWYSVISVIRILYTEIFPQYYIRGWWASVIIVNLVCACLIETLVKPFVKKKKR